jgi:Nrap protein domain 3
LFAGQLHVIGTTPSAADGGCTRHTQDGSIAEAVVWDVPPGERHLIVDELLSYALRRHLPLGTAVQAHCGMLDAALAPAGKDLTDSVAAVRLDLPALIAKL